MSANWSCAAAPPTTEHATILPLVAVRSGDHKTLGLGALMTLEHNNMGRRKKKFLRFPQDDGEFYSNIWAPHAGAKKFIDISQVAHALTTIDYKTGYMGIERVDDTNIWSRDSSLTSEDADDRAAHSPPPSKPGSDVIGDLAPYAASLSPPSQYKTLEKLLSTCGSSPMETIRVAPPSRHDGSTVIFSSVLSSSEMRETWSASFLLGMHEPVRHALYVIDRFLERVQQEDTLSNWNAVAFFKWFNQCFAEYLRSLQNIKAAVLRPLVQIKYGTKREIVGCYEETFFLLQAISLQEDFLVKPAASTTQSWQDRLEVLLEDIRRLSVLLNHALDLEEMAFQPALLATFSEETFIRFVMPRVFRAAHPKRVVIPWIIERSKVWGGEKKAATFKHQLSFTSRFMYDRVWHPHFIRHVVATMKILDAGLANSAMDVSSETWFGCQIQ